MRATAAAAYEPKLTEEADHFVEPAAGGLPHFLLEARVQLAEQPPLVPEVEGGAQRLVDLRHGEAPHSLAQGTLLPARPPPAAPPGERHLRAELCV